MEPTRFSGAMAGWLKRGLIWLFLLSVIALRFADPEPLPTFRNALFDFAQQVAPATPDSAAAPVTLIEIDEASLAARGQWPWSRDVLADLVEVLAAQEPRALGINVLFPEADRLSPENLLQRFPMDAPLRESLAQLPANDELLAFSLRQAPAVLGAAVTTAPPPPSDVSAFSVPILLRLGQQGGSEIRRYPGLLRNIAVLDEAASGIGVVSQEFSGDGVVRRLPIVMLVGDAVLPSFAVEVARVALGAPAISVEIEGPGISSVKLGDLVIQTAFSGEVWLRDLPAQRLARVSAQDVLSGAADPALLRGRILLLGLTAGGLANSFATPRGDAVSALELQARAVHNLMDSSYLLRPQFAVLWELAVTLVLAITFVVFGRSLPGYVGPLALTGVVAALFAGSFYAFSEHHLLLDPTYPTLIFLLAYLIVAGLAIVEAQAQRRRSEQDREMALILAEAANRSKTSFLANMSHELRTPLNAILGFSEMMKREIMGPVSPPKYRDYVEDIYHMGLHLLSLVNDILEMAKVEAGESQLNESEFSTREVVEDCVRTVSAAYRDRGARAVLDSQSTLPRLSGDQRMFTQMVLNLMSNAVKYTPDSGKVQVSGAIGERGAFRLSVSDTGIGMTDQEILEAFEPFRRIDHALASNFEGIGLGLPLTKAMVEMHGGKLEIASISNHGTTATLIFPAGRVRGPAALIQDEG